MIAGIVMAAGLSERMGGSVPKQLLRLGDRPLVSVVTTNAVASSLDRVVVVTGHHGAEIAAAVEGTGATAVANPDYRRGNMTSFRAAHAAEPGCEAYVILLADMPGVTTAMIDRMVGIWNTIRPWAAVAEYTDGRRHPLLLSAAAMGQAVSATGPKAVWRLLEAAPSGAVKTVEFPVSAPLDVNTIDDYESLIAGFRDDSAQ
jgi:molybdenum cofactor cytidylyltransferase